MTIGVLGCAGFIGSRIYSVLRYEYGSEMIVGYDNHSFSNGDNLPMMDYHIKDVIDITDSELTSIDILIFSFCSNIIYCQDNEIETIKNNAVKAILVAQKFKGKIINLSTASVYNNATIYPTPERSEIHTVNSYDTSKYIFELFLKTRGNYTSLRLSNVYSMGQRPENKYCGVIGKMVSNAISGKPIDINGDGNDTRDFTAVDDVVDSVIKCIELPAQNTEINIATSVETSILDLAHMIHKILDNENFELNHIPKRKIDGIRRRCLSIKKAKELLDWSPKIDLKDGLSQTISWQVHEYGEFNWRLGLKK